MKTKQFDEFKKDVRKILGKSLVGEVGPADGQYAFCTSEPDLGENVRAKSIKAIIQAQSKYSTLDRCSIMPFGISGHTTYVIAGIC